MNNNEPNISIYGDDAGEDFPVLKAFQQYIDAEQAKARKRLITISIIFTFILLSVIFVFARLLTDSQSRLDVDREKIQELNNRLVEFAVKDSENLKASALHEASLKTMTETMQKLQQRLEDQELKATQAAANAARELAAAKAASASVDPEFDAKTKETTAKLQKAVALLKAEKAKLAAEKEKFRQQQLERYRREHYPEYYARKNTAGRTVRDIDDDLEEIADENDEATSPSAVDPDEDNAIEYFTDDNYTIPVEVKGRRAGWRVPMK